MQHQGQADRPAEIVYDERDAVQAKAIDELPEHGDVRLGRVGEAGGTLGQAESKVIGGDAAMAFRQRGNHVAVLE